MPYEARKEVWVCSRSKPQEGSFLPTGQHGMTYLPSRSMRGEQGMNICDLLMWKCLDSRMVWLQGSNISQRSLSCPWCNFIIHLHRGLHSGMVPIICMPSPSACLPCLSSRSLLVLLNPSHPLFHLCPFDTLEAALWNFLE